MNMIASAILQPFFSGEPNSAIVENSIFQVLFLIGTAIAVWYFSQRLLAALLIRKSNSFCPQCYTPRIWPVRHRGVEALLPFVPRYNCGECGKRFYKGGRTPFGRCPHCRSAELQSTARRSVNWNLPNLLRMFCGARGYECTECGLRFFDFRPLRQLSYPELTHPELISNSPAEIDLRDR